MLVAFAQRPDLEDALGIVQDEILDAALRATLVGALVGLLVAALITRRLRRIASAAAAVEQGRFEGELRSGFPDELGVLAQTVDQMREHLARSFADLEGERDRLRKLLEQLQEAVVAVVAACASCSRTLARDSCSVPTRAKVDRSPTRGQTSASATRHRTSRTPTRARPL